MQVDLHEFLTSVSRQHHGPAGVDWTGGWMAPASNLGQD